MLSAQSGSTADTFSVYCVLGWECAAWVSEVWQEKNRYVCTSHVVWHKPQNPNLKVSAQYAYIWNYLLNKTNTIFKLGLKNVCLWISVTGCSTFLTFCVKEIRICVIERTRTTCIFTQPTKSLDFLFLSLIQKQNNNQKLGYFSNYAVQHTCSYKKVCGAAWQFLSIKSRHHGWCYVWFDIYGMLEKDVGPH